MPLLVQLPATNTSILLALKVPLLIRLPVSVSVLFPADRVAPEFIVILMSVTGPLSTGLCDVAGMITLWNKVGTPPVSQLESTSQALDVAPVHVLTTLPGAISAMVVGGVSV